MIVENKVIIEDNMAIVVKSIGNIEDKVYILQYNNLVIMVKDDKVGENSNFIPYSAAFSNIKKAHEEWLQLIGDMCKKDIHSKYFKNPIHREHLVNGKGDVDKSKYKELMERLSLQIHIHPVTVIQ